jgi:hypothetical protein
MPSGRRAASQGLNSTAAARRCLDLVAIFASIGYIAGAGSTGAKGRSRPGDGRLLVLARNFTHNAHTLAIDTQHRCAMTRGQDFAHAHMRGTMRPNSRHFVALSAAVLLMLGAPSALFAEDAKPAPAKPEADKGAMGSGWSQEVAPANGTTGRRTSSRR